MIRPEFLDEGPPSPGEERLFNYGRIWRSSVAGLISVSLIPILVLAGISFVKSQHALEQEIYFPVLRQVSDARRSISFLLTERKLALTYVVLSHPLGELADKARLNRIFLNLKRAFGGFVDLGVITDDGIQQAYVGPYELEGKNYGAQPWFTETILKGFHVSEVFKGFRGIPHVVLALKVEQETGGFYILRATLDAQVFDQVINALALRGASEAFLINSEGVIQTPSRRYGPVLERLPFAFPRAGDRATVEEVVDDQGRPIFLGQGRINDSPFTFVMVEAAREALAGWRTLALELTVFLVISVLVVVIVALRVATVLVGRVYEADRKRTSILHEIEYTSKMASLGRLSAGVAHEINNPLAIINEKAGLMKDYLRVTPDEFQYKERFLALVEAILGSVKRCRDITHRLLGFARHMKVEPETLDLRLLLGEVVGFLGKEAHYRDVIIAFDLPEDLPTLVSDRGQLQQVFLNIINNAMTAVDDGGRIDISARCLREGWVEVVIADTGAGIPADVLPRIFEPFFSTKGTKGAGLGLSITYGIVKKLGGEIKVESQVGVGTRFKVELPIRPDEA